MALERSGRLNASLHGAALDEYAPLTATARALLRAEIERNRLTGRGYHRIRRVARTIADLDAAATGRTPTPTGAVDVEHVEVALSLRTRLRAATPGLVA